MPLLKTTTSLSSFNSPFGILFVRTSVLFRQIALELPVSIPHSEFCSFGLHGGRLRPAGYARFQFPIRNSVRSDIRVTLDEIMRKLVSIPHSEFCSFGPPTPFLLLSLIDAFQFPIRNSVRSDLSRRLACSVRCPCFNSPFGILFVRTRQSPTPVHGSVIRFNSPFGILFVRTGGRCGCWLPSSASFNSPFGILFVRTPGLLSHSY